MESSDDSYFTERPSNRNSVLTDDSGVVDDLFCKSESFDSGLYDDPASQEKSQGSPEQLEACFNPLFLLQSLETHLAIEESLARGEDTKFETDSLDGEGGRRTPVDLEYPVTSSSASHQRPSNIPSFKPNCFQECEAESTPTPLKKSFLSPSESSGVSSGYSSGPLKSSFGDSKSSFGDLQFSPLPRDSARANPFAQNPQTLPSGPQRPRPDSWTQVTRPKVRGTASSTAAEIVSSRSYRSPTSKFFGSSDYQLVFVDTSHGDADDEDIDGCAEEEDLLEPDNDSFTYNAGFYEDNPFLKLRTDRERLSEALPRVNKLVTSPRAAVQASFQPELQDRPASGASRHPDHFPHDSVTNNPHLYPQKMVENIPEHQIYIELHELDQTQSELKKRGHQIEQVLHCLPKDGSTRSEESELIGKWLELVRAKNKIVRRENELMHMLNQRELEETQERLNQRLRTLIHNSAKTAAEAAEEEQLVKTLVDVVEQRNEIVQMLEQDRVNEEMEDRQCEDLVSPANLREVVRRQKSWYSLPSFRDKRWYSRLAGYGRRPSGGQPN